MAASISAAASADGRLLMRAASAVVSVHTSDERLPVSGRLAKGPAGRKCSNAMPSCGISCAMVVTTPDW